MITYSRGRAAPKKHWDEGITELRGFKIGDIVRIKDDSTHYEKGLFLKGTIRGLYGGQMVPDVASQEACDRKPVEEWPLIDNAAAVVRFHSRDLANGEAQWDGMPAFEDGGYLLSELEVIK